MHISFSEVLDRFFSDIHEPIHLKILVNMPRSSTIAAGIVHILSREIRCLYPINH